MNYILILISLCYNNRTIYNLLKIDIEVLINYRVTKNFVNKNFIQTLEIFSIDVRSTKVININRKVISRVINEGIFRFRINLITSYNYIVRVIII